MILTKMQENTNIFYGQVRLFDWGAYFVGGSQWYIFVAGCADWRHEEPALASCQTPMKFPVKEGKGEIGNVFVLFFFLLPSLS